MQVELAGRLVDPAILSDEALDFIAGLHGEFAPRRVGLLEARRQMQLRLDAGHLPDFASGPPRTGDWTVPPPPADLADRRTEITGPVDPKMMINALNSRAKVFMADFEDATSPTWTNLIDGQANLIAAYRGDLRLETEDKTYQIGENPAVITVRPRGWHLPEKHLLINQAPASASLFDFGLYIFHAGREALAGGTGPYLYLPKLENHLEARLWNDVFWFAEDKLGMARGTIRATVLIENVLAAFEMDEILFELRDHATALNAGRWDYIFSVIKKFRNHRGFVLPDRAQVTMTVPFMRAYTELLVATCHRRGAHAIGGMAAFIPNRRDPEVTERALAKVSEDKRRESSDGFDGTWVAHPDLVSVAIDEFDRVLGVRPNQLDNGREDVFVQASDLLDVTVEGGRVTNEGVKTNVDVGIRYLAAWLSGTGAAAIHNLMEDAATAEISRSQIWQWIRHGVKTDEGHVITGPMVADIGSRVVSDLGPAYQRARTVFEKVALSETFADFLTLPAYELID